jgi:branched-chain amino acid transport system permease protein
MEHYLVAIAVAAGIYALMALGMNVIWGMAGLINLALSASSPSALMRPRC